MSKQEPQETEAFQVRDRRSRLSEESASPADPPAAPAQPVRSGDDTATDADTINAPPQNEGAAPARGAAPAGGATAEGPATFSSFILSMATSALGLLQEGAGPSLTHARQIIDTLGLLQEKTKGNLTPDETTLLSQVLYSLRMHFVEVQTKGSRLTL